MNQYALKLAIWGVQMLLSTEILERIRGLVVHLMTDPRQSGETHKQHNDRRRDYVVEVIKGARSDLRTALIEAAIALLVAQVGSSNGRVEV